MIQTELKVKKPAVTFKCKTCGSESVSLAYAKQFGMYYCMNCTHINESDVEVYTEGLNSSIV